MAREGSGLLHKCVDRLDQAGEQRLQGTRPPMVNVPSTDTQAPQPSTIAPVNPVRRSGSGSRKVE